MMKSVLFLLFLFLLVSKIGKADTVNEGECTVPLSNLNLTHYGIAHMVGAHQTSVIRRLEFFTDFLFSHFTSVQELINYTNGLDVKRLDMKDRECFSRAITLYLMTYFRNELFQKKDRPDYDKTIMKAIAPGNAIYLQDFKNFLQNRALIYKLFKFKNIDSNRKENLNTCLKQLMEHRNSQFYSEHEIRDLLKNDYYNKDLKSYNEKYSSSIGQNRDNALLVTLQDSFFLFLIHMLPNIIHTDMTYVNFDLLEKSKSKRMGFKKRSSTFDISCPNCELQFPAVEPFNRLGFYNVNDLVNSFISMMKYKMVLANSRLVREYHQTRARGNNFKVYGLRGLRRLKHMFSKKNIKNFFAMHYDLVNTELKFLSKDFLSQLKLTLKNISQYNAPTGFSNYLKIIYVL